MTNPTQLNRRKMPHTLIGFFLLLLCACGESMPRGTEGKNLEQIENQSPTFRILILGDSLTEGYGVSDEEAYPTLLEEKLNAELGPKTNTSYKVVNGGISGATTSGGVSRIEWFLKAKPDYLLVALGGNDGLRGIPVKEMKKNIDQILRVARKNHIPAMIAGMKIPPNYGPEYSAAFTKVFEELAKEHEVPLIPFLLEGVGGNPKLNLPDRIHPNALGHETLCLTVYKSLVANLN